MAHVATVGYSGTLYLSSAGGDSAMGGRDTFTSRRI